MSKPNPLKPGDTIGIAASASPFDRNEFLKGIENLKSLGFKVFYRDDIFNRERYLAGSDKRRGEELEELIENPEIKAVLFARGGYGMMRILPWLHKKIFKSPPKIVLGYSDITTFLNYLYQKYGWVTFYGPVVAKDLSSNLDSDTKKHFFSALTQSTPLGPFQFADTVSLRGGACEGVVVGGCLSLVVSSLGTPFEINADNKILFLEDTNEKPYSIDRMLTQLLLAGKLKKVKGILFGSFVNGGEPLHFREAVEDVLKDFAGPILFNFPAGHSSMKVTVPLGIKARLDADKKEFQYLEAACEEVS